MTKLGNRIHEIVAVDAEHFVISLEFTDGLAAKVRLAHLFERPKGLTAEILRGDLFAKCFVESGALAWPNGLELCPDAIRRWIEEQDSAAA